jgi:hypothetical protein
MEGVRATPRVQAIVSFYGYGNISGEWYDRPDAEFLKQPRVTKEEADRVVGGPILSESTPDQRSTSRGKHVFLVSSMCMCTTSRSNRAQKCYRRSRYSQPRQRTSGEH